VNRRLRVGVIFGGRSVEHEVSLMSARSVMAAIDEKRFEVVPIGVTRDGCWLTAGDPLRLLSSGAGAAGEPIESGAVRPALPGLNPPWSGTAGGQAVAGPSDESVPPQLDVVFPLVHGIYGEDGTLQGLLEIADVAYVGAGVLASALGMDKDLARRLFQERGLPVVPWRAIRRREWLRRGADFESNVTDEIGLPCFVKPSGSGSSVGVSKVRTASDLADAVEKAFEYDLKVLVERAINAREIEVAVLGNDEPAASVPGEIIPCHEFYDYEAKYLEESELLIPAPLEPAEAEEARRVALEVFRALDMSGLARVDFFLDRDSGKLVVNEVNSLPGFTPVSMYPKLWEASGIPYRELISRLIDLALERHRSRTAIKTTYGVTLRT
jgi:D-alanine-D-alanine ligase